ncbi:MAG: tRNA pseudouridine(38-40) synthase TruA [Opitutales bacterium]
MGGEKTRWRCLCAYDGTDYAGWQSQITGRAIQDVIEEALAEIVGSKTRIHGSGRTDAGVHAKGQVFHFDAYWMHGGEALRKSIASRLSDDIQILDAKPAPSSFHARGSAKGKRYVYRAFEGVAPPMEGRYRASLPSLPYDVEAMQLAAKALLGEHDFRSFGASLGCSSSENPVKNLWRLDVRRRGKRWKISVEGSGFLYKMVRGLSGALFDVGRGRLQATQIKEILKERKRTGQVVTAPANGLCLEKVFYRGVPS